MQIALTKKLADAKKLTLPTSDETIDPLFTWTANWTRAWENRKNEDILVLVNSATQFTVAIYEVKRKDLNNMEEIIRNAISNTLLAMNINQEIIDEYWSLAGDIEFVKNSSRQAASRVSKSGQQSSFYIDRNYSGVAKVFDDTMGKSISQVLVQKPNAKNDYILPSEEMVNALTELTGKNIYDYHAFELLVTLDLGAYKATRQFIVAADLNFSQLHNILQSVYRWENSHLYDFTVYEGNKRRPIARLVPFEEDLEYDSEAILMDEQVLSDYFPMFKRIVYTYDYGDNWQHHIRLVREIEHFDMPSPYLVKASGQAPPEDVGGVGGFLDFLESITNPNHPEYEENKVWAGFWSPELSDWETQPRLIH
ncbi:plasmid pRiA4b ORF-3 family protein [Fundicoccus culcitae]|uniref:Plasmid pRiA4b ORF-3 family protein n=1 Tax=Fundicoccus culcitae TaxID=2969821 RepID=A0ABY5P7V5_9LACT|nr:plasmid pRiA4b ORF-3 family protein [Fundicoccus culcitae]UUX34806.1 plasmid pRiA4b ORF-3 family protein [Fundicoccus culcitae]